MTSPNSIALKLHKTEWVPNESSLLANILGVRMTIEQFQSRLSVLNTLASPFFAKESRQRQHVNALLFVLVLSFATVAVLFAIPDRPMPVLVAGSIVVGLCAFSVLVGILMRRSAANAGYGVTRDVLGRFSEEDTAIGVEWVLREDVYRLGTGSEEYKQKTRWIEVQVLAEVSGDLEMEKADSTKAKAALSTGAVSIDILPVYSPTTVV
ncbi:hypothetical protein BJ742DRAFT_819458 [Cladochytrium replicatum]|nr:hypothetical protein BJ742DRAFT_819458 [Cladochytrium replicatum]